MDLFLKTGFTLVIVAYFAANVESIGICIKTKQQRVLLLTIDNPFRTC